MTLSVRPPDFEPPRPGRPASKIDIPNGVNAAIENPGRWVDIGSLKNKRSASTRVSELNRRDYFRFAGLMFARDEEVVLVKYSPDLDQRIGHPCQPMYAGKTRVSEMTEEEHTAWLEANHPEPTGEEIAAARAAHPSAQSPIDAPPDEDPSLVPDPADVEALPVTLAEYIAQPPVAEA